jgi:hypothetical protein
MNDEQRPSGEIILFQGGDGTTKIQVRIDGQTVWLTQRLLAELYQVSVKTVNEHLSNIYGEAELIPEATIRKFRIVQAEGKREVMRLVDHYSLEAILAVGYRVRSSRGTLFRQWATEQLQQLLVKGFVLDDERLKQGRTIGQDYFDELLARIRDIRSSERMFWRKVLDIYATSIDYDANADLSKALFATLQNKMHWAAHGRTAAEVISERADADKPNMGLNSWSGSSLRRSDVGIAKNYLVHEEPDVLNRIVPSYLEFAELQALSRKPMYMKDWVVKLDDFLRLSEREILKNAGKISHDTALQKAELEYAKYRLKQDALPQPVDQDFEKVRSNENEDTQQAKLKIPDPRKKTQGLSSFFERWRGYAPELPTRASSSSL